ncbi:UNVERIFIED_CONTAM: hypothetical protein FKN15_062982 [Acipenser sinensis]
MYCFFTLYFACCFENDSKHIERKRKEKKTCSMKTKISSSEKVKRNICTTVRDWQFQF